MCASLFILASRSSGEIVYNHPHWCSLSAASSTICWHIKNAFTAQVARPKNVAFSYAHAPTVVCARVLRAQDSKVPKSIVSKIWCLSPCLRSPAHPTARASICAAKPASPSRNPFGFSGSSAARRQRTNPKLFDTQRGVYAKSCFFERAVAHGGDAI